MSTNTNRTNTTGKYSSNKAAKPFPASADPLTTQVKLKKLGLGACIVLASLAVEIVLFLLFFRPEWITMALMYLGLVFLGLFAVALIHRIGFIHGRDEAKAHEKRKHNETLEKLEVEHQKELEFMQDKHRKELDEAYQLGHEASASDYFKAVKAHKRASHLVDQLEDELSAAQQTIAEMEKKLSELQQEHEKLLQTNAELVEALPETA